MNKKEISEIKNENKNNIYPIYTANSDTYEKETWVYAYVTNNTELTKK
ncbi:hypothetical protein LGK97_16985 [Clostridium sp. CS001]|nr:hypothetical protein [Clostridium sp. CS001]MCB2291424.1 hypothetical protein [Clostridium sp. CS001]